MKRKSVFILKGNIVYSKNQKEFSICENGYVVCKDGIVEGVYKTLPFNSEEIRYGITKTR